MQLEIAQFRRKEHDLEAFHFLNIRSEINMSQVHEIVAAQERDPTFQNRDVYSGKLKIIDTGFAKIFGPILGGALNADQRRTLASELLLVDNQKVRVMLFCGNHRHMSTTICMKTWESSDVDPEQTLGQRFTLCNIFAPDADNNALKLVRSFDI